MMRGKTEEERDREGRGRSRKKEKKGDGGRIIDCLFYSMLFTSLYNLQSVLNLSKIT